MSTHMGTHMSEQAELAGLCWPLERAGEALAELARRAGFAPEGPAAYEALTLPPSVVQPAELERWFGWAAGRLGIDAEAVEATLPHTGRMLLGAGPALLRLPGTGGPAGTPRLVLLLGSRRGVLRLLGPDLIVRRCRPELLRDALCAPYEAPLAREIERLLDVARVPDRRRPTVRAALLAERLAQERVGGCWMLRLPPAGGWWRQVGALRIPRRVALMLALFILLYGCELLGWGLIGNAALNGHVDAGWLAAWLLLVLSMVPLRLAGGWLDSGMLLDLGQAVKRRLFAAALAGDRQEVRRQGVGRARWRPVAAGGAGRTRVRGLAAGGRRGRRPAPGVAAPVAGRVLPAGLALFHAHESLDRTAPRHDARAGGAHGRPPHLPCAGGAAAPRRRAGRRPAQLRAGLARAGPGADALHRPGARGLDAARAGGPGAGLRRRRGRRRPGARFRRGAARSPGL
jgi:hypothetical protein